MLWCFVGGFVFGFLASPPVRRWAEALAVRAATRVLYGRVLQPAETLAPAKKNEGGVP